MPAAYRHEIILGVPGSGKTTLARKYSMNARRVIFFDPHGDYEDMKGVTRVKPFDLDPETFKDSMFRVCVLAGRDDRNDTADEFVYVARWARWVGNLLLVCDEVGDYNTGQAQRALRNLHRNGHKQGVSTLFVSQRATEIPLGCRASATRVYSLLQQSKQDLDSLRTEYGDDFANKVQAWRAGQAPVVWTRPVLFTDR